MNTDKVRLPLEGLKVIDASTMLAGPWACTYLADFGAEVIKIEHPEKGDHARSFGRYKKGVPILWKTLNRNKKAITLNLGKPEGQELFKKLVTHVDIVVENFRPGTFEKWNLGWDILSSINPSLIMLRTTGYGQTGPYSSRAGFGTIAEGMSSFTSVNGSEKGPPTLPGIPLADGVNSAFGALSIMIALYERNNNSDGRGQYIDISIYEPLMRFMEAHLTAFDQLGIIPKPLGNGSMTNAPRNAYETKEGKWLALSGSSQDTAMRVFEVIGREELKEDERFATNENRLKNVKELDSIIGSWIKERELEEVVRAFNDVGAAIGPMYDVSQVFEDSHFKHRESFVTMEDEDFGEIRVPNVFAKFSKTPGKVRTLGPEKGKHNHEIYQGLLALSDQEIDDFKSRNII
ncbi:MAG: hypothetical protein JM58_01015 [Peptococcaceae bacterium BICA1-8]|nr:MAG: hypothetical protein JM58_01015 [Peptococcaceae bacterium BICA1-8]